MFRIFDGFKAYALGIVLMAIGGLEMMTIDVVPSIDPSNAWSTIATGWGIIAARSAFKKIE